MGDLQICLAFYPEQYKGFIRIFKDGKDRVLGGKAKCDAGLIFKLYLNVSF